MAGHAVHPSSVPAATVTWTSLLVGALLLNAALLLAYRLYRLSRGGPMGDVIGGAVLAAILAILAAVAATGGGWARWPALVYALLFAVAVMPVWTLAVLIPLPPGAIDYAFTAVYWITLVAIGVAAVMA